MKPPILDRIRMEDLPEAPEWFEKVLYLINRFIETVYQLFNKNLTFTDNFNAQIYTDTINQNGIDQGYKIRITINGKPQGVLLVKLIKAGGSHTIITTAPYVDWTFEDGLVWVQGIAGIVAGSNYEMTLLIF